MRNYYRIKDARPSEIEVGGWIRDFIKKEGYGMPGNLGKIGYPFNRSCWSARSMTDGGYAQWWPYEQSAYWVDSLVRASAVLKDDKILDAVREQIENSVKDDGEPFMGPSELKAFEGCNRWPHAVFFRALWMMFLYTGDEKYVRRMREHYLSDKYDYHTNRDIANVECMYRVAEYYGDEKLKKKANRAMQSFDNSGSSVNMRSAISDLMPHTHGVDVNENTKMGAVAYLYTGNEYMLNATKNSYEKLAGFHMLPDGVHTCYEATTGNESFKVHESCDISDYTYGLSFLLKATADGKYADRIERACFNALPGATGKDFRTAQYFSCVNQIICTRNSTHLSMWANTPRMAYQPHHYPECCVANIGRAMPNYALNMYGDCADGLYMNLYGESKFDGENISVEQNTDYPFEDTINIKVREVKGKNTLHVRIPEWSKGYELTKNGKAVKSEVVNGYVAIKVSEGDAFVLKFNYALTPAHSSDGGIYYYYGPLLLSLKLNEKWEIDREEKRQTKDFPAYNVTTEDDFGYALSGYEGNDAVITKKPISDSPFWDGSYPIEIKMKAKRLKNWTLVHKEGKKDLANGGEGIDEKQIECGATRVAGDLIFTPRLPSAEFVKKNLGEDAQITLVPYGCTRIRLTVFPKYDFES
ncbi:MAG: glycoside hydrolase family 127 protein [Eubacteriales bacterium]|nr:glycoside hydrolase family 127 protein [Eubacteriales bacterium]